MEFFGILICHIIPAGVGGGDRSRFGLLLGADITDAAEYIRILVSGNGYDYLFAVGFKENIPLQIRAEGFDLRVPQPGQHFFRGMAVGIRWDKENDTIITIVPLGGSKGGANEPPSKLLYFLLYCVP